MLAALIRVQLLQCWSSMSHLSFRRLAQRRTKKWRRRTICSAVVLLLFSSAVCLAFLGSLGSSEGYQSGNLSTAEFDVVRGLVDAARSSRAAPIPPSALVELARVGHPHYADDIQAAPALDVELPPGSGLLSGVRTISNADWWGPVLPGWEPTTFAVFRRVLDARPGVVIDFGAWVGPTAIAAARLNSTHVYALEVDPVAFTELVTNVASNPAVAAKTSTFFLGITDRVALTTFSVGTCSERIGDSCSSMVTAAKATTWQTQCMPLGSFAAAAGILRGDISLIKIDVEGAEDMLLPSLRAWLSVWPLGRAKPAIRLSIHDNMRDPSTGWKSSVDDFMRMFRYGYGSLDQEGLILLWSEAAGLARLTGGEMFSGNFLLLDFSVGGLPLAT